MNHALAKVYSAELEGIHAKLIEVEVDLNVGLHAFNIVGLADKALNEARERVNSALKNSGAKPPNRENRKITVNLAPADIKKTGAQYDLAIALGYLRATEQIQQFENKDKIFIGELALDGRLRPINGALNIAQMAQESGFTHLYLPSDNANEAAVVENLKVIALDNLSEAVALLEGRREKLPVEFNFKGDIQILSPDFSEIKGQDNAKRALTISAAGGHNLLMIGPPGVGKSLLAQALVGILPKLTLPEAIEITKIYSSAGLTQNALIRERPFRSPHQTASLIAVVGGGSTPRPGEISLAHRGVLFLDELPEFQKNILESLRQPIESGLVRVARAKGTLTFPAKFSLIAAMNPCPCGFYGDSVQTCSCSAHEVIRYQKKISGPLLDRIDLQIKVPRVELQELRRTNTADNVSPGIKNMIELAREVQRERFKKIGIQTNSEMSSKEVERNVHLEPAAENFLNGLTDKRISPRGYYRLLKTAQTIADLEQSRLVSKAHLAEAFSYRLRENI